MWREILLYMTVKNMTISQFYNISNVDFVQD
jgi:hypothetical protein